MEFLNSQMFTREETRSPCDVLKHGVESNCAPDKVTPPGGMGEGKQILFAPEKCAILLPAYSADHDHELFLNNQRIRSVNSCKYLGFSLDPPKGNEPLRLQSHLANEIPRLKNLTKS
eukprot:TRINITY_DN3455_c0_g1_i1.p1 TRINITY_DN3455_c0_g1~~TRINITY_DN3455_c0_g1_i1.p1  ORF type:complete len:117 (-),score=7.32 TRINITY_DN3455_c0_g1_i1:1663-2013(-)